MHVLITGAGGQLAHALAWTYSDHDVVAVPFEKLDIGDNTAVTAAVDDIAPDLVLNAAAYTAVDACESDPNPAWRANAAGPWWLAQACARRGITLVHFSTDYVFSGDLDRPYTEFDQTGPTSIYGQTKLAGEQLVRETTDRHVIVRTSWLHGDGTNFLATMLRLGRERGRVRVVNDQRGSPTFTFDLAPAVRTLIEAEQPGTFHLTNSGTCTWFELAQAAYGLVGLDVMCDAIDTATFGAPAPRPANSALDNRRARLLGLPELPAWQASLRRWLGAAT